MLLFGSETWVLTLAMLQRIEGIHVGFLRQVMLIKDQRLGDNTWRKEGGGRLLRAAGTKPLRECINRRQAMVAEWVALCAIFKVYTKEMVYKGGGRLRKQWWQQMAAELQLKTMPKEILASAWECW